MSEHGFNPEQEKLIAFQCLREKVHQEIEREVAVRIAGNPIHTEEELLAGAFREMIEPQVRDAVFECIRKGYTTESSGFGGDGEIQVIDGSFKIDYDTQESMKALGVEICEDDLHSGYTTILFRPRDPNLETIKAMWAKIVQLLPHKQGIQEPSMSGGSMDFRKQYAPQRSDIELAVLRKRLKLREMHPDVEAETKKRIAELERTS